MSNVTNNLNSHTPERTTSQINKMSGANSELKKLYRGSKVKKNIKQMAKKKRRQLTKDIFTEKI